MEIIAINITFSLLYYFLIYVISKIIIRKPFYRFMMLDDDVISEGQGNTVG